MTNLPGKQLRKYHPDPDLAVRLTVVSSHVDESIAYHFVQGWGQLHSRGRQLLEALWDLWTVQLLNWYNYKGYLQELS